MVWVVCACVALARVVATPCRAPNAARASHHPSQQSDRLLSPTQARNCIRRRRPRHVLRAPDRSTERSTDPSSTTSTQISTRDIMAPSSRCCRCRRRSTMRAGGGGTTAVVSPAAARRVSKGPAAAALALALMLLLMLLLAAPPLSHAAAAVAEHEEAGFVSSIEKPKTVLRYALLFPPPHSTPFPQRLNHQSRNQPTNPKPQPLPAHAGAGGDTARPISAGQRPAVVGVVRGRVRAHVAARPPARAGPRAPDGCARPWVVVPPSRLVLRVCN